VEHYSTVVGRQRPHTRTQNSYKGVHPLGEPGERLFPFLRLFERLDPQRVDDGVHAAPRRFIQPNSPAQLVIDCTPRCPLINNCLHRVSPGSVPVTRQKNPDPVGPKPAIGCEPAGARRKREGNVTQPRWPWLRLFRIIELEVVVEKLSPKSLRLVSERGTLGVDLCNTRGVFRLLKRLSIGHHHDIARDEVRACKHPRHHQAVAVRHDVNGQLDEPQREVQPVKLQIFGYCLHPLADPVADDQEEEAPTPKVCGERIVELLFVDLGINSLHQIEQRVAVRA